MNSEIAHKIKHRTYANDEFMTPHKLANELVKQLPIYEGETVLEPCYGDGAFKEALPYTSETVRKSLKFTFSLSHVPLCAIEPNLIVPVLENPGAIRIHSSQILLRPDDEPFLDPVTYHAEPQCLECDLFDACEKVYPKNSHLFDYSSDVTAIKISSKIRNEISEIHTNVNN